MWVCHLMTNYTKKDNKMDYLKLQFHCQLFDITQTATGSATAAVFPRPYQRWSLPLFTGFCWRKRMGKTGGGSWRPHLSPWPAEIGSAS